MRNIVFRRFIKVSITPSSSPNYSLPFVLSSRRNAASAPFHEEEGETVVFPRESPGFSYGLNWALARKGVVVKDKAFCNLTSFELRQKGATIAESLSGLPVHVRGNFLGGASEISKGQFSKLLKQVTSHLSSISSILVHDGAIGSSSKCNANVRVVSDSPSAVLSLSNVLWKTHARAVSHDSRPLTVYVATSISPGAGETIGLGAKGNNEFIAADIERSSLILCGRAFSDTNGVKEALGALSGPIISSRGGLPLSARVLQSEDSIALLFASEDTIQRCTDLLVSVDAGVILSSQGVAPMFQIGNSSGPDLFRLPNAVILVTSDSSGVIPSVSELSPGQAAYHFLAGCQNVKFIPAYSKGPSSSDPLELSKALLSKLKENQISSFLINTGDGKNTLPGKDLLKLLKSAVSKKVQPFEPKAGASHVAVVATSCLGHGNEECIPVAKVVEALSNVKVVHVATGDYTTFVVSDDGDVYSFGCGESPSLGHNSGADGQGNRHLDVSGLELVTSLKEVKERVVQISLTNSIYWNAHTFALTESGKLYAFGAGDKRAAGN